MANIMKKLPELETILALCKAAPLVQSSDVAAELLNRLSPYLPESYAQVLAPSPSLRDIDPSPYEVLTGHLTSAILSIGVRHGRLRSQVITSIAKYVKGWTVAAAQISAEQLDDGDRADFGVDCELARVMTLSLSLLGFLNASAEYVGFWSAYERLQFVEDIRAALSEKFMISFETALSIVRNARSHQAGLRDWKRYAKYYAVIGRPLGAMILHDSFLKMVVACATLLANIPSQNTQDSVLDYLRISYKKSQIVSAAAEDALVEGLTRISQEEMDRLENDLDYLQRVGSAWQQRQASAVKAKVLTTYLCCTVYDEEIADPELLMVWLDNALNDPVQTADITLSSTVLKSMVILAKISSSIASSLGRTLPRIIVQGGFDYRTSTVAADCLASVLSLLPQDAIITTLYSLGNVITTGPVAGRSSAAPVVNGARNSRAIGVYNNNQTTGSAISLTPSDVEEPHHAHTTVVQTVISVAKNCKDEKITALALSMLIQKIGHASKVVEAKIIADSAHLGIHSGPGGFSSLLKSYSKLCHDALVNDDLATLEAVSTM